MDTIDDNSVRIARDEPVDGEQLAAELPATVQLELVNPKPLKSGETHELTFAEPTGKHISMINAVGNEKAQLAVTIKIISECCGIGPDEYDRLGTRDIARLNEVLSYFLTGGSPQTEPPKP